MLKIKSLFLLLVFSNLALAQDEAVATIQKEYPEEIVYPYSEIVGLWPHRLLRENLRHYHDRKKDVTRIMHETRPSIEIYPVDGHNSPTPAVIICPGGAYKHLAYDLEGTEIAKWFNEQGITAILLRYTVPTKNGGSAFYDLQRAINVVRHRADGWNIDKTRVGIIGFSAGGHMAARISTDWKERVYDAVDEADNESLRPDFAILAYPAYLSDKHILELRPDVVVTSDTPPAFIVAAKTDRKFFNSAVAYFDALNAAGIKNIEGHFYDQGDHGFGMRPNNMKIDEWPDLLKAWLDKILAD